MVLCVGSLQSFGVLCAAVFHKCGREIEPLFWVVQNHLIWWFCVLWVLKDPYVYFTPQGCRELVAKRCQGVGIQVFLQNTQTCVRFCGEKALLVMEGGIILKHVFKMKIIFET